MYAVEHIVRRRREADDSEGIVISQFGYYFT
jgi:hypothetical protein